MSDLVKATYHDLVISFTEDAWFNATAAAESFGKRIQHWLDNQETKDYIEALADFHNHSKKSDSNNRKVGYLKTKRGKNGGTWLHPDLAVPFARWLDIRFGVWCDQQIKQILKGNHPHYDWKKLRHEATSSYKVMGQILQMTRERLGKTCAPHHFSNEARLINHALTGAFGKVDRNGLDVGDLDLLAKLENLDTVLIGCGTSYDNRKKELEKFAADQRVAHLPVLENAA
jgi:hypothetical protein